MALAGITEALLAVYSSALAKQLGKAVLQSAVGGATPGGVILDMLATKIFPATAPDVPPARRVERLASELSQSEQHYIDSAPDLATEIEKKRVALLERTAKLQNRVLFEVSDSALLTKVVPLAVEQTTLLYLAKTQFEFSRVEVNLNQVEAVLRKNEEYQQTRVNHRWIAVSLTIFMVIAIVAILIIGHFLNWKPDTSVPIIGIPIAIILWSCIGSLGAMLYRFNTTADAELSDPLRWSFTRPLTGILMGIIAYMVFSTGVTLVRPDVNPATAHPLGSSSPVPIEQQLLWLAAFLAGFSDRFADTVLHKLTGRFGGDQRAEPLYTDKVAHGSKFALDALVNLIRPGSPKQSDTTAHEPKPEAPAADKAASEPEVQRETNPTAEPETDVAADQPEPNQAADNSNVTRLQTNS